jgi:uncharacterized membrane protein
VVEVYLSNSLRVEKYDDDKAFRKFTGSVMLPFVYINSFFCPLKASFIEDYSGLQVCRVNESLSVKRKDIPSSKKVQETVERKSVSVRSKKKKH